MGLSDVHGKKESVEVIKKFNFNPKFLSIIIPGKDDQDGNFNIASRECHDTKHSDNISPTITKLTSNDNWQCRDSILGLNSNGELGDLDQNENKIMDKVKKDILLDTNCVGRFQNEEISEASLSIQHCDSNDIIVPELSGSNLNVSKYPPTPHSVDTKFLDSRISNHVEISVLVTDMENDNSNEKIENEVGVLKNERDCIDSYPDLDLTKTSSFDFCIPYVQKNDKGCCDVLNNEFDKRKLTSPDSSTTYVIHGTHKPQDSYSPESQMNSRMTLDFSPRSEELLTILDSISPYSDEDKEVNGHSSKIVACESLGENGNLNLNDKRQVIPTSKL
jgi:hypothetical protein